MADKRHYIITSLTLGAIAAASAALIGLANLITKGQIAKNEKNKIKVGIVEIYGKNATISSELSLDEENYQYVETLYDVKDNEEKQLGYAFRTTGSNMYGKISMIVGFNESDHGFIGIYVTVNEQTYASTLEDNYIVPLNGGERDVEDVSCGATYGAKLIRDMINEAKEVAEATWKE